MKMKLKLLIHMESNSLRGETTDEDDGCRELAPMDCMWSTNTAVAVVLCANFAVCLSGDMSGMV